MIRHAQANNTRTSRKVAPNIAQTPPEPDTLGGWGPRAELVDQSLPAYTPVPSNPSFMGAFVPHKRERLPLFGRGFELRCFQLLSSAAWLPGNCPVGQPVN